MKYLFGDSTESGLDFNYLAFLKDVIDCAVVLVENEATLDGTIERRKAREQETAAAIASVEELGSSIAQLAGPVAKEHGEAPVGRAAAAIAAAARDAIERESARIRAALAGEVGQLDDRDRQLREGCRDVCNKLLRVHDLPDAEKVFEVVWAGATVKATMRQRTKFGIDAVIDLDIPAGSMFALDLRVDRIADGIEVNALEASGWLKKSDKLVPHKLGRYHITRIVSGKELAVELRATADANAAGFDIRLHRDGHLAIERTAAEAGREVSVDDRHLPALLGLLEKLEAALRALGANRTQVSSIHVDGTALGELAHPRILAERLINAVAPVVHKIAHHSRSPGELVLRVPVGNDRREEVFIPISELVKRFERLPAAGQAVFAPLALTEAPAPPARTGKTIPPPPPQPRAKTPSGMQPLAQPAAAPAPAPPPPPVTTRPTPTVPMPDRAKTPSQRLPPAVIVDLEPDAKSEPGARPDPAARPDAIGGGIETPAETTARPEPGK